MFTKAQIRKLTAILKANGGKQGLARQLIAEQPAVCKELLRLYPEEPITVA